MTYKIEEEHVAGLSRKTEVKKELWDSHIFVETAVAERRTAGIWCGSEEAEWCGFDGGSDGCDGPDGVDGCDGCDGDDGSVGDQTERIGVDDVLGYDYHGKMAVLIDHFCIDSKFWL